MATAPIDDNTRQGLIAESSNGDGTIVRLYADPTTHRLLVDLAGGAGTVTSVSVVSANGFAGVVANATTTPAITLTTTVIGVLKGNGTAISAAVAGTDYVAPGAITTSGLTQATARLLGRTTAGTGAVEEISVGSGLTFAAGSLSATGVAGSIVVGTTTITSGTDTRILYNNAGVLGEYVTASAATASAVAQRDANGNIFFNNYLGNATSTVSAAGTTVLTAASSRFQALTGSSNQTYQLPDATTLSIGPWFVLNNNSSGSLIITNAGGSTLYTVPAGGVVELGPTSISTANGTWDFHPLAPSTVTWSSGSTGLVMNSVLTTSPTILAGASSATAPSFIPQRAASTTGFGGDGTNLHAIIAGATSTTFNSTGLSVGTSGVITTGTIELGAASDTTISRSAAGVIAVEGVVIPSISSTNTITNKRNQPRTASSTTSATLTPDLSTANVYFRTTQTEALTIGAPTGTPVIGETIAIYVDSAGAQTLTMNATYIPFGAAFPATTTAGKTLMIVAQYNGTNWKTTWQNAV